MIAALLLLAWSCLIGSVGRRVLRREWTARAPRAATVGWQALSTSMLLSILLAAVALAVPFLPVQSSLNAVFESDAVTVIDHYETPLGIWPGVAGLSLVLTWAMLLAVTTARGFRRTMRIRRSQRTTLRLVSSPHPDGFMLVDHPIPVAYCLPGRGRAVVLSSAAMELLNDRERALVLGHEFCHLRARHHVALAYADALQRTFPWLSFFVEARAQVAVLLEMCADDAARGPTDRRALAGALVALGTGVRPATALGASDTAALQRVRRLLEAPTTRPRGVAPLTGAAVVAALAVPVGLVAAPAIEAIASGCCALPPAYARAGDDGSAPGVGGSVGSAVE